MRQRLLVTGLIAIAGVVLLISSSGAVRASALNANPPPNVDVSQRHLNESEEAIAVNPTNPNNIVIVTNVGHREAGLTAGMFAGVSFDGGLTWTRRLIGNNDNLGDACCDPSLSFDEYGNLFMTYLYQTENQVPIALSTDSGLTFNVIANIAAPPKSPGKKDSGDNRGLFRFVDQPTITAAHGEVWSLFNAGGPLFATGAPVMGLGQVGEFQQGQPIPGTNNCTYGDIAIGPAGQVMQTCSLTESGQGGGRSLSTLTPMVSAPRDLATGFSWPKHTSVDLTLSRRNRTARRRRNRPGLGSHRWTTQRPCVPGLHERAAERERRHRHLRSLLR